MKYELMQKHIERSYHGDINPHLEKDNSNVSDFFCSDVVGARRFALNFGGYPRSEIAEINATADINQQINLLTQLNDYSPTENPNAGLSDAEIMLGHRSKYCQAPSEMVDWLTGQIHDRDMKRLAAEQPAEQKIDFNNNENTES